jgi:periplasmic protein TonB
MLPLPRTRSFDRRRPWMTWWIAVGMAVVTNVIVVIVLSQISNLQLPAIPPPLSVRTLRQLTPPPPPPPPPVMREKAAQPVAKTLAIPLPALDLPAVQPTTALTLPELPRLDALLNLPVNLPAFEVASTVTTEPQNTLWPNNPGEPDEPAQLLSAFDLERFYPRLARLRGISGQTQVRLTIDETGHVLSAHVYLSTPQGVFEVATKELSQYLQFRPARLQGKAVASVKDLVIDWTLK